VKGGYAKKSEIELVVKDLAPRLPFNPYVTSASPYSVSRGLALRHDEGEDRRQEVRHDDVLTLSDFDLASRGGQQLVLEQLGIPLTVAIALLRDWKGNIDLTVPVKVDEKGTSVAFGTVISGALVQALVGTLTSPLKISARSCRRRLRGDRSLAPLRSASAGLTHARRAGEEQVKQLARSSRAVPASA
jgi:hypothetical protein